MSDLNTRIAEYLKNSNEVTMHAMHPNVLLSEAQAALAKKEALLAVSEEKRKGEIMLKNTLLKHYKDLEKTLTKLRGGQGT